MGRTLFDEAAEREAARPSALQRPPKPFESAQAVDVNDPVQVTLARVSLLGDRCLAAINMVMRAANRNYQLTSSDWENVLQGARSELDALAGAVHNFNAAVVAKSEEA